MKRKTLYIFLYFIVTTLILIIPSLYNGYPLVHQDSGHYLNSSRSLQTHAVTPPGYVFFVRVVSWQSAIWLIAVAQAFILNLFLYFTTKSFLSGKAINYKIVHLALISLLTIFSGMGWYANLIMPDIFAAYALFGFYFLVRKESKLYVRIINGFFIFWATVSHFSNFYLIILVAVLLLVFYFSSKQIKHQINILFLLLIFPIAIAGNLFIRSYNYYSGNGFILSRYEQGAIMAKFIEYGILEDYLRKTCPEHHFTLCDFQGKFPATTGNFIWDKTSPYNLYKSWDSVEGEYNTIIRDIVKQPKYIYTFIAKSIYSSGKQFFRIKLYIPPYTTESAPYGVIKKNFPFDFQSFKSSLQYNNQLDLTLVNQVYFSLYGLSIFYLIVLILLKKLEPHEKFFTLVIFLGAISNAIVFGTLATVVDRFQSRIGWILIVLAFLIFSQRNYVQLKNLYLKYRHMN